MPASRLIDWWWGDGDPDSCASAAFCGFSVSRAEPGAVGWWREWLHRDGLAPESCQCTFHDSMNSDVRDQAKVTLLRIISGSHPNGVPCGWRSSRCCIKSHPTAKKSWPAWLTSATWASGVTTCFYKGRWNISTFVSLNNCGHQIHSELARLTLTRPVDAHWGFSFSALSVWNPVTSDPTSTINFLPMSQLRWWVLQLIIPGLTETKNPRLKHEMYVS